MLILSISTSGATASAAIYDSVSGMLKEALCDSKKTHSETLMPQISDMLDRTNIEPEQIELFAADIGPGSFTGVRIGIASINALAAALNRKVVGISSLEALAFGLCAESVVSLIDARNGNGYAAHYVNGVELLSPSPIVIKDFLLSLPDSTLFTGDGAAIHRDLINTLCINAGFTGNISVSAAVLAKMALMRYNNGAAEEQIMPLYLRPSQAERLYGK